MRRPSRRDTVRPVVLKLRGGSNEATGVHCGYCGAARFATAFAGAGDTSSAWRSRHWSDHDDNALLDGLRNHGWIDGQNLIIEYRYAQSQDRLPALAAELVALSPDLLIAGSPQTAVALKSATATIPIVFVAVADPVGIGLVQSLSRPGGNITGLATLVPGFASKEIEILREIVPTASKIAVLANPGNPMHRLTIAEELPQAAQQLGVALPIVEATTAEELDIAFASAATQHADAIVVLGDPLTLSLRHASYRARGEASSTRDLSQPIFRHQWRIDFIRPRFCRFVFSCRRLRG